MILGILLTLRRKGYQGRSPWLVGDIASSPCVRVNGTKAGRRADSCYGWNGHRHRLAVGAGGKSRPVVSAAGRALYSQQFCKILLTALMSLRHISRGFAVKLCSRRRRRNGADCLRPPCRCHRDWAVGLGALGPQPGLSSFRREARNRRRHC
jgi:hypothetical protein